MPERVVNEQGRAIVHWTDGVEFEASARAQVESVARLPFIWKHVAVMPDVHWGRGATVGSVIATDGAIVPAAVGVDIGCGMMAIETSLRAEQLPDSLSGVRKAIERAIPVGGPGKQGSWLEHGRSGPPAAVTSAWKRLEARYRVIAEKHPRIERGLSVEQLGTLGTGNHFIELCLDTEDRVWLMLHSGSRGPGNRIGSHFIEKAKEDMRRHDVRLPDAELAYLREGSPHFDDYVQAVAFAQAYASTNRELMMARALDALREKLPPFQLGALAVNCHHNYVERETHFGREVWVTRKGALRARSGDLGIIPGSMGARSFIVRGKGNADSFSSCSHGAGRKMSRAQARKQFTLADHARATEGVECRKDAGVIDETPGAYKDVDAVMRAQTDLVEIVHTLRQIVCVKG